MSCFRSLAEGHRSLSEQRIIAAIAGRSTNIFNYLRPAIAGHLCPSIRPAAEPWKGSIFRLKIRYFRALSDGDAQEFIALQDGMNLPG
jgi:hypothetical protein